MAQRETYRVGDPVELPAQIVNSIGQRTDPVTVLLEVVSPSGLTRRYRSDLSPVIKHESCGVYVATIGATETGTWSYTWRTSGGIELTSSGKFNVVAHDAPAAASQTARPGKILRWMENGVKRAKFIPREPRENEGLKPN